MDEVPQQPSQPQPSQPHADHPAGARRQKRRLMLGVAALYAASLAAACVLVLQGRTARNEALMAEGGGKTGGGLFNRLGSKSSDTVGWVSIRGPIMSSESGRPWEHGAEQWARRIEQLADTKGVKAIVLDINSPGGSVGAVQEIYSRIQRVKKEKHIPFVALFGDVAASGGYYIAASADKIVAEPGTITGSIGVVSGKISFGKSIGMIGVTAGQVGVGKNALMNSGVTPYTPEQWASLNAQVDAIYADFLKKVSDGRKLPLAKVQEIARGRVWTGADASERGLVDKLGGFWTAVDLSKKLAGIAPSDRVVFELYPRQKGFFDAMDEFFSGPSDEVRAVENFTTLMNAPIVHQAVTAVRAAPRGDIEMRATNLPQ